MRKYTKTNDQFVSIWIWLYNVSRCKFVWSTTENTKVTVHFDCGLHLHQLESSQYLYANYVVFICYSTPSTCTLSTLNYIQPFRMHFNTICISFVRYSSKINHKFDTNCNLHLICYLGFLVCIFFFQYCFHFLFLRCSFVCVFFYWSFHSHMQIHWYTLNRITLFRWYIFPGANFTFFVPMIHDSKKKFCVELKKKNFVTLKPNALIEQFNCLNCGCDIIVLLPINRVEKKWYPKPFIWNQNKSMKITLKFTIVYNRTQQSKSIINIATHTSNILHIHKSLLI